MTTSFSLLDTPHGFGCVGCFYLGCLVNIARFLFESFHFLPNGKHIMAALPQVNVCSALRKLPVMESVRFPGRRPAGLGQSLTWENIVPLRHEKKPKMFYLRCTWRNRCADKAVSSARRRTGESQSFPNNCSICSNR